MTSPVGQPGFDPLRPHLFYRFMRAVLYVVARVWFRLEARGLENIPVSGPALLACNHVSHLDPVVTAVGLRRPVHFLAKADLFSVPIIGWAIARLNSHPIARESSDRESLRVCSDLLRAGCLLIVFPEGTRSPDGNLQPGQPGVALLAQLAGCPVVPVYISGTYRAMPRKARWIRPCKVRIQFGPAFDPLRAGEGAASRKERNRAVTEGIMAAIGAQRDALHAAVSRGASPSR